VEKEIFAIFRADEAKATIKVEEFYRSGFHCLFRVEKGGAAALERPVVPENHIRA
jgi:hypothetical protein